MMIFGLDKNASDDSLTVNHIRIFLIENSKIVPFMMQAMLLVNRLPNAKKFVHAYRSTSFGNRKKLKYLWVCWKLSQLLIEHFRPRLFDISLFACPNRSNLLDLVCSSNRFAVENRVSDLFYPIKTNQHCCLSQSKFTVLVNVQKNCFYSIKLLCTFRQSNFWLTEFQCHTRIHRRE